MRGLTLNTVRKTGVWRLAIATGTAALVLASSSIVADAVEFGDGTIHFNRPPTLLGASTTEDRADSSSAIYYFTLNLSEEAGEPLQRVSIVQENNTTGLGEIDFEPDEVRAFVGTRRQRGTELTLGDVVWNEADHTLIVTFDPPVPPGNDVTLRIEPRRNPRRSGVYLFGVTAFPAGETVQGQFLGYGRLHFYDSGDSVPFSSRYRTIRFQGEFW